jgi:putative endonuclease
MAAKDDFGRAGEERAARHLTANGFRILDRNWRCPQGEIDIVAETAGTIVVVEVKTRASEAIDKRKAERLWRLAMAWIAVHPMEARRRSLRIDAIAVLGPDPRTARLEHLEDAL